MYCKIKITHNTSVLLLLFMFLSLSKAAKICRSTSIPFHTWVQMDYSCAQARNCGSRPPFTQWNDIGYENGNGGTLRDESKNPGGVYRCSSWFVGEMQGAVARVANAQQERSTIDALVGVGWNTARYGLIAGGLTSITCNPSTGSWAPRNGRNNVCWTFTCAYSTYLYRVLGLRPSSEFSLTNVAEIPITWTCKPEQYGKGDGCQCNCGSFDPDCNPFESVALDCPNSDDICIPGSQNVPVCELRHEVLSDRKLLQIQSGVAVHHPQFFFSNETDVDGAPWGNYSKTYIRGSVPTTWTCNPLFYGSKDGCDCACGAWDPDCDMTSQKVFNCDTSNDQVRCTMSRNNPSEPVCLYDRMADTAAVEAGYPSLLNSDTPTSTAVIIGASIGTTVGVGALIGIMVMFFQHRQTNRHEEGIEMQLTGNSAVRST